MENVNNAENLPDLSLLNEDFANGVSESEKWKRSTLILTEENKKQAMENFKQAFKFQQDSEIKARIERLKPTPQIMQGLYPLQKSLEQAGSNQKLQAN